MALVIDATVGGAASNSYVTLAEAEAYFLTRLNVDSWTGTDDIKNRAISQASLRIDFEEFEGERYTTTQALKWPRTEMTIDNKTYPVDEIPVAIKNATYELALYMLGKDMTAANTNDAYDSVKLGPLEVDFNTVQPSNNELPPYVLDYLTPFLDNNPGIVEVFRG